MVETVQSWELPIAREDDVVVVRRKARALAQERGFDPFAAAALATAASELARNAWIHAGGGKAIVEELTDGHRTGIRLTFVDEGPGIVDVDRVMQGGFGAARSPGLGVSGTRRLVEEFDLQTKPGRGTKVSICKWTRF